MDLIAAEISAQAECRQDGLSRASLLSYGEVLRGGGAGPAMFAFCFSAARDDLSQWREYAAKGTGYSLGFETKTLSFGSHDRLQDHHFQLLPVTYDASEQEATVRAVVREASLLLDKAEGIHSDYPEHHGLMMSLSSLALAFAIAPLLACLKNPAFRAEQEWRLVHFASEGRTQQDYRVSHGTIVPYVTLRFRSAPGMYADQLPLAEVVQGPIGAPDLGRIAVQGLLATTGNPSVNVAKSTVPLRF